LKLTTEPEVPTHPFELPDSTNLAHLLVYLGVAALVGELAAHAGRRAAVTEAARDHLADEQAALRRVATLVASQASPDAVFAAVAREVGQLLDVDATHMARYEHDDTAVGVGSWSRTGDPVRGIGSSVGAPIVVDGSLWGVMSASSKSVDPLPADTESRIAAFTELVAMAISNIQAREDLAASRARIVAAADDERRRVVRDLHDGAQQRLVHSIITLKLAHRALEPNQDPASELVAEALGHAESANVELRELAHGILPTVLTHGGLRAGVEALASRMPVPVENDVCSDRLPRTVEATAYFVVAEALTNVAKHSHAGHAAVTARIADGTLAVEVRDDGVGGARPDGSGLLGLGDRLASLDGQLRVESPADGGTLVTAEIPLAG